MAKNELEKLSFEEKIKICENKVRTKGGDIHGWFDAFNPEVSFSFTPEEVQEWFKDCLLYTSPSPRD